MTFTVEYADILVISYIVVGFLLCILLIYLIRILYNILKLVKKVNHTAEVINDYVLIPVRYSKFIFDKIEAVVGKLSHDDKE